MLKRRCRSSFNFLAQSAEIGATGDLCQMVLCWRRQLCFVYTPSHQQSDHLLQAGPEQVGGNQILGHRRWNQSGIARRRKRCCRASLQNVGMHRCMAQLQILSREIDIDLATADIFEIPEIVAAILLGDP